MQVNFEVHESLYSTPLPVMRIEPLIIEPKRLAVVLEKLAKDDKPVSFLELQRLGVPRMVCDWLMTFANDTITERELVSAFVRHLLRAGRKAKEVSGILKLIRRRDFEVLNDSSLTVDERLVLPV